MDRYFKNSSSSLQPSDLHALGVTAMFIASKYEDIYALKMSLIYEKIGHKKIPVK